MRRVCLLSAWFRERIHTSGVSEFLLNGLGLLSQFYLVAAEVFAPIRH